LPIALAHLAKEQNQADEEWNPKEDVNDENSISKRWHLELHSDEPDGHQSSPFKSNEIGHERE